MGIMKRFAFIAFVLACCLALGGCSVQSVFAHDQARGAEPEQQAGAADDQHSAEDGFPQGVQADTQDEQTDSSADGTADADTQADAAQGSSQKKDSNTAGTGSGNKSGSTAKKVKSKTKTKGSAKSKSKSKSKGSSGTGGSTTARSKTSDSSGTKTLSEENGSSIASSSAVGTDAPDAQGTGNDSDAQQRKKKQVVDYASGTHHAKMKVKGYGTVQIEVESEYAPVTADEFCRLVDKKYYDGRSVYWFLTDIYSLFGSGAKKDKGVYCIRGEYEEAGFDNKLPLKRGTLAMSRTQDGRSSDASSLILFLSDCSYLNGKYAAFARITHGMNVFDEISQRVAATDEKDAIRVTKKGKIADEDDCPVIKTIRMVD